MAKKIIEYAPEILAELSEETKSNEEAMRQLNKEANFLLSFIDKRLEDVGSLFGGDLEESRKYWERLREMILESRGEGSQMRVPLSYFNVLSKFLTPATEQTAKIWEEVNKDINTHRAANMILQLVEDCRKGTDTKIEGAENGAMAVIRIPESEFKKRVYGETVHHLKEEAKAIRAALERLNGKPIQLNVKFARTGKSEAETETEGKKKKWKLFDYDIECPIWSISKVGEEIYIYFCKLMFWDIDTEARAFFAKKAREKGYLPKNVIVDAPKVIATRKLTQAEKSAAYTRLKAITVKTYHKKEADLLQDILGYSEEWTKQKRYKMRQKVLGWFDELKQEGVISSYKYNGKTKTFSWEKRQPTLWDDYILSRVEGILNCLECKKERQTPNATYKIMEQCLIDED